MTEEQRTKKREYMRRYREKNHDRLLEKGRIDYVNKLRKDGMTAQQYYKAYYSEHRDKIRLAAKRWRERNPEKVKANNARNYAKRRAERVANKGGKKKPDTEKAKALFKDPKMQEHFQWLIDKAEKSKKGKPFESK